MSRLGVTSSSHCSAGTPLPPVYHLTPLLRSSTSGLKCHEAQRESGTQEDHVHKRNQNIIINLFARTCLTPRLVILSRLVFLRRLRLHQANRTDLSRERGLMTSLEAIAIRLPLSRSRV